MARRENNFNSVNCAWVADDRENGSPLRTSNRETLEKQEDYGHEEEKKKKKRGRKRENVSGYEGARYIRFEGKWRTRSAELMLRPSRKNYLRLRSARSVNDWFPLGKRTKEIEDIFQNEFFLVKIR